MTGAIIFTIVLTIIFKIVGGLLVWHNAKTNIWLFALGVFLLMSSISIG